MAQAISSRQALIEEDLAIQDTLMMSDEERVDLLVSLIIEKILEDNKSGEELYTQIVEVKQ